MITIIIAATQSERSLIATLSALVPAAVDGLVREAIVADREPREDISAIADASGCGVVLMDGPPSRAVKAAAETARAPWLLFLRAGIVLEPQWIGEARRFIEQPPDGEHAAMFRRASQPNAGLRELRSLLGDWLGTLPHPDRGLLIGRDFYQTLGGHREGAADAETDLIRRIGKKRITILAAAALRADT